MICKCGNQGVLVSYLIGGDDWYCRKCKSSIVLQEHNKEEILENEFQIGDKVTLGGIPAYLITEIYHYENQNPQKGLYGDRKEGYGPKGIQTYVKLFGSDLGYTIDCIKLVERKK